MPPPWFVQVEPTRRCNLQCSHCTHPQGDFGDMSPPVFGRILEQNPNAKYILFQGLGEPLLNPNLPAMIRMAKEAGCRTAVISNGVICPDQYVLENLDAYVVSLETLNLVRYYKIRGTAAAFALITLDYLKHNFNGYKGINCALIDATDEADVFDVVRYGDEHGFTVTLPQMGNWLSPGQPGYEAMLERVNASYVAHPLHAGKPKPVEPHCPWSYQQAYYDYIGRLHVCCQRMNDCYDLGRDWNGLTMQFFRLERATHSFCKECPL